MADKKPTLKTICEVYAIPVFLRGKIKDKNVIIEVKRVWSDNFGNSLDVYLSETIGL